jgi:hypothetical protein
MKGSQVELEVTATQMDDRLHAEKAADEKAPEVPTEPPDLRGRDGIVGQGRPMPKNLVQQPKVKNKKGGDHLPIEAAFVDVIFAKIGFEKNKMELFLK